MLLTAAARMAVYVIPLMEIVIVLGTGLGTAVINVSPMSMEDEFMVHLYVLVM